MEVGAVKQAFNNEVIQLKKNLNQAKIQVIHKLTRKAKTLTEKKSSDHLKEKNKKKAESAVKEVLIMKKLKPRDIARFIITHKGELNSHLNKPDVDNDKACARLLLHKVLQQKYKSIKNTFRSIPIKDLLMSRQERIKLKKEAKELQKNKKQGRDGIVNAAGGVIVEDSKVNNEDDITDDGSHDDLSYGDKQGIESEGNVSNDELQGEISNKNQEKDNESDVESQDISDDDDSTVRKVVNDSDSSEDEQRDSENSEHGNDFLVENDIMDASSDNHSQDSEDNEEIMNIINKVKQNPSKVAKSPTEAHNFIIPQSDPSAKSKMDKTIQHEIKPIMKMKENKNKNLKEKLLNRKFRKDTDDSQSEKKVVDPFFITASGGNYMSVAEQRPPDEVKEIHSQGNRKERRAVMFGHVPHFKPRREDSRQNVRDRNGDTQHYNGRFNKYDDRKSKFNNQNSFNDKSSKLNDRSSNFNDRRSSDGNSKFGNRSNDRNFNNNKVSEPKEEKLHPSWEAKKKQSGILPYKGKKIVFD